MTVLSNQNVNMLGSQDIVSDEWALKQMVMDQFAQTSEELSPRKPRSESSFASLSTVCNDDTKSVSSQSTDTDNSLSGFAAQLASIAENGSSDVEEEEAVEVPAFDLSNTDSCNQIRVIEKNVDTSKFTPELLKAYNNYLCIVEKKLPSLEIDLAAMEAHRAAGNESMPHFAYIWVEQKDVGKVIGKGGETIARIRNETGVTIDMNQETKEQGYSMLKVEGSLEQLQALIEVLYPCLMKVSQRDQLLATGENIEMVIQQVYIGKLIGKAGENIERIKRETGADVQMDQSKKDEGGRNQGYTTARILGTSAQRFACHEKMMGLFNNIKEMERRGEFSLAPRATKAAEQKPRGAQEQHNAITFSVPNAAIGSLIGKGGCVINPVRSWAAERSAHILLENRSGADGGVKISGPENARKQLVAWVEVNVAALKMNPHAAVKPIHSITPSQIATAGTGISSASSGASSYGPEKRASSSSGYSNHYSSPYGNNSWNSSSSNWNSSNQYSSSNSNYYGKSNNWSNNSWGSSNNADNGTNTTALDAAWNQLVSECKDSQQSNDWTNILNNIF